MKNEDKTVTIALDLYYKGLSARKIKDWFKQFLNKVISHVSILDWIRKYVRKIKRFTDKLKPKLSGYYYADEITIKCEGREDWYWDLIDAGTRFLVSTVYSKNRGLLEARELFSKARRKSDIAPNKITTDGLQLYETAFKKEFKNKYRKGIITYARRIASKGEGFNTKMERFQGTIRERIKVMRGFGNINSAELILDGLIIYYNFVRVHQAIGTTPAEKAGINLNLEGNKWLSLIERAIQSYNQKDI